MEKGVVGGTKIQKTLDTKGTGLMCGSDILFWISHPCRLSTEESEWRKEKKIRITTNQCGSLLKMYIKEVKIRPPTSNTTWGIYFFKSKMLR